MLYYMGILGMYCRNATDFDFTTMIRNFTIRGNSDLSYIQGPAIALCKAEHNIDIVCLDSLADRNHFG